MKNIQLYLVSGFLGSGKTTFLRQILQQTGLSRVGVIVNEFGSVGIDGKLLQSGELTVEEINDGSIFCACLKEGFVRTLAAFLELPVDLVFVEASGMADPSSMENLLAQMDMIVSRKGVERRYDYRGSVCVVDAKLFPRFCDLFEAPQSQIRKSSFLVANKIDTVSPEELAELHDLLREINPAAKICDTTYGQISLEMMEAFVHPEQDVGETLNCPDNRPETCVVEMEETYSIEDVERFCRLLGSDIIRCKGFFRMPEGTFGQVDNAQQAISVGAASKDTPIAERDLCLVFFGTTGCDLEGIVSGAWAQVFGGEPCYYD